MSQSTPSTTEIFRRLGDTPVTRSARAEKLFRKLRNNEADEIFKALQGQQPRPDSAEKQAAKS